MKNVLAFALCACAVGTADVARAADVGVSIGINEPGLYGRVDLGGGYPPPQVYNAQPVYIQRGPPTAPPIYLHVPPGHQRNWRRYCGRYDACGQPVYFVQDHWYRDVYRPRYREFHRDDGRRGDGGPRFDGPDHRGDPGRRGDDDRRGDRGRGDDRRPGGDDDRGRGR